MNVSATLGSEKTFKLHANIKLIIDKIIKPVIKIYVAILKPL